jgi:hypothetical protein
LPERRVIEVVELVSAVAFDPNQTGGLEHLEML